MISSKIKRPAAGNSIAEAIRDMLECGAPRNEEIAEYHFAEARAREATPALNFLAGAKRVGGQVLHVPLGGFGRRDVGVGSSGGASLVGQRLERVSDLLSWSACVQAGAMVLEGLREDVALARTSRLPAAQWVPEIGFAPSVDPDFSLVALGPPRRVSGAIIVSKQLLMQAGPGLDRYLSDDLSRACSSQLDRICLYGPMGLADAPVGILGTPGTHRVPID